MQATSKGSDQTARMRMLIWDFAGRTYHFFGNLTSWLSHYARKYELIWWKRVIQSIQVRNFSRFHGQNIKTCWIAYLNWAFILPWQVHWPTCINLSASHLLTFFFKTYFFQKKFRNTTRVWNHLDPDSVSPDLCPNCLESLSAEAKSHC